MPVDLDQVDDVVPPSKQEVTYLPSGKIRLLIDDRTIVLRRPKMGEFRSLRELFYEAQDEQRQNLLDRISAEAQDAQEAQDAEAANDHEARMAAVKRSMERASDLRRETSEAESAYLSWSRRAVETLGGVTLEQADEDLPLYFATGTFVNAVQQHWMVCPLPSGVA